jgi:hypothetical protein
VYLSVAKTLTSYEIHDVGNGRQKILATSGRMSHIVRHDKGAWPVDQDEHQRVFPTLAGALDCARELTGDPDLRTLTEM